MSAISFMLQANGFGGFAPTFQLLFADAGAGIVATTDHFGATPTFTRATSSWTNLSDGTIGLVASGSPRSFYSPAGVYLGYLAEGARTNLCQRGEDFANVWAAVGTPTITAGTTTVGALSLSTIGDDSAAALEGYTQTITHTGDAVKAYSIYVKKGTSTSSVVRLRDTTASADRLLAAITWSGAAPVVTMTTGTDLTGTPAAQGASGVYRLSFATTSVTAANTNSLQVYPATDAALSVGNTGTIEWGGVQAEDATFPSTLIRTPGSATVTRNADVLNYATTGWLSATKGTLLAVSQGYGPTTTSYGAACLSDGTLNNRIDVALNGGASNSIGRFMVVDGGVTQADLNDLTGWLSNTNYKMVAAWSANDFAHTENGIAVTTDVAGTVPAGQTQLDVGCRLAVLQTFGTISSIRYFPNRLQDTLLQKLTT